MTKFFVNAPPTKAEPSPDNFNPEVASMGRYGYLVEAATAARAVQAAKAFRRGEHWSLDFVQVVSH